MKNKIIVLMSGIVIGMGITIFFMKCVRTKKEDTSVISPKRFELGFHIFSKWIKLKNEGKTLEAYFKDNEISTVAIYGMGALGERLYEELKQSDITVAYAIDRIAGTKNIEGLRIVGVEDSLDEVDAIIVTPVQDFYAIEEKLEEKTDADIISLEDIVDYFN